MIERPAKLAPRIAVLLHKVGPYDSAQLTALAEETGADVRAIEFNPHANAVIYERALGRNFSQVKLDNPLGGFFGLAKELGAALEEFRPSGIVVPGWNDSATLLGYHWGAKHSVPVIVRSASVAWDFHRTPGKEWVKRCVLRHANAAIVGGSPQKRYMSALGMQESSVFDSCDVVDNDHFRVGAAKARAKAPALRKKLGLPTRFFLYCGRFTPEKNLDRLLTAYAQYRQDAGPGAWSLVFVGDGPLRDAIVSYASKLGLKDSTFFPGKKSHKDLPTYYGLASAFVLPSLREPWGLVINEAEAAGLPVLVSKACGAAEDLVKENLNGYTFDPLDVSALAAAMKGLTKSRHLRSLGKNSEKIIKKWPPARYAFGIKKALAIPYKRGEIPLAGVFAFVLAFLRHKKSLPRPTKTPQAAS